ncbi:IF4E-domain-containing protein [Polychaeton citri CBS 116435]|uniref:IF4E-domain-containing protein n=1 Tax=Polychaeton citri CBS 116435 TaxID=1314669 RepID=A0A9P4UL69_9PEZI|nr:IF4E-domain-containing protein [Polychaeton citri CBS 116435]
MANSENANASSPSDLWTRRSQSQTSKLSLAVNNRDRTANPSDSDGHTPSSSKRFGSLSRGNTLTSLSGGNVQSPTATGVSPAFGFGTGAFASFGSGATGGGGGGKTPTAKTPSAKTPGQTASTGFAWGQQKDKDSQGSSEEREKDTPKRPAPRKSLSSFQRSGPTAPALAEPPVTVRDTSKDAYHLRYSWILYLRPPTGKNVDYEASIKPQARFSTAREFFTGYTHLKRPSALPVVSDYHIFREGIRPVWEDEANRAGGKWILRLKKGVADRYWEELLFALIGDQFTEASDEVCGAVVSVRQGEDVISIWTRQNGGRNVRVRETLKRVLSLPQDTQMQFKSHDASIEQRAQADQAREQKGGPGYGEKRRNTTRGATTAPEDDEDVKA